MSRQTRRGARIRWIMVLAALRTWLEHAEMLSWWPPAGVKRVQGLVWLLLPSRITIDSCGCMNGLVVMLAHDGGSQAWSFAPSQEALIELSSTCSSDATHAGYLGLFHSQTLSAALAYRVRGAEAYLCLHGGDARRSGSERF